MYASIFKYLLCTYQSIIMNSPHTVVLTLLEVNFHRIIRFINYWASYSYFTDRNSQQLGKIHDAMYNQTNSTISQYDRPRAVALASSACVDKTTKIITEFTHKARGGYLVERWVRGCAAQIGCFFGLSGFAMAPFLFENWF